MKRALSTRLGLADEQPARYWVQHPLFFSHNPTPTAREHAPGELTLAPCYHAVQDHPAVATTT